MKVMTGEEMIRQLSIEGEDNGADYHDGEDVEGWFSWHIVKTGEVDAEGDPIYTLKITHQPDLPDEGEPNKRTSYFTITAGGVDR